MKKLGNAYKIDYFTIETYKVIYKDEKIYYKLDKIFSPKNEIEYQKIINILEENNYKTFEYFYYLILEKKLEEEKMLKLEKR